MKKLIILMLMALLLVGVAVAGSYDRGVSRNYNYGPGAAPGFGPGFNSKRTFPVPFWRDSRNRQIAPG